MSEVKILTDIKIAQCPVWLSKTDYFPQNTEKNKTVEQIYRLPHRLFSLWSKSGKYEVVITADIKTAQLFGLLRRIFRRKKPKHIILELMLDEARNDIRWKIKNLLQRVCFSTVDVIFVSSKREVETYSKRLKLPEGRIRFLPFHTNIIEPKVVKANGRYIFSAGKTGRDYATLAAAVTGLNTRVIVVSDRHHVDGVHFPPNVEVLCDIPYERYMELLHGCSIVVVPLKKLVKSTGQVVFLEAMALGKPVIATNTIGTEDYIEDGKTGILVPPEDYNKMRDAINSLMSDSDLCTTFACAGINKTLERYTFSVYTKEIIDTAQQLINRS